VREFRLQCIVDNDIQDGPLRESLPMAHFIWTQKQDIGPAPRSWSAMAFDGARRQVVMFGGLTPPNDIAG
jgi:hypothetical protein